MGNIVDYIREYGDASFEERPFSDEDALALAQFSYLKLEGAVAGVLEDEKDVTIGAIRSLSTDEKIFADTIFAEKNKALYEEMCKSRRFQNTRANYYVNRIDAEKHSQFSAVSCFLEEDLVYIAFRGTDETLAGWREDFDMACHMPVKCQELSVEYLELAAPKCKGRLIVGGHSKGGNLAVYASLRCHERIRKRIERVYNLDGPGFLPGYFAADVYKEMAVRIRKMIPHASLVGMLFEDNKAYEVVESNGIGILQHDAFTWIIEKGRFVTVQDVYKSWKITGEILNRWLASLSAEQIKSFTEELFSLFDVSEVESVMDFQGNWKKIMSGVAWALGDMDKETRRAMWKVGKALFKAIGEEMRNG